MGFSAVTMQLRLSALIGFASVLGKGVSVHVESYAKPDQSLKQCITTCQTTFAKSVAAENKKCNQDLTKQAEEAEKNLKKVDKDTNTQVKKVDAAIDKVKKDKEKAKTAHDESSKTLEEKEAKKEKLLRKSRKKQIDIYQNLKKANAKLGDAAMAKAEEAGKEISSADKAADAKSAAAQKELEKLKADGQKQAAAESSRID